MADTAPRTGYAPVNGLEMYYEMHGSALAGGVPLVLIHGSFSATGTSFGALVPGLSEGRQVIAVELQGHGHTADIDRPLSIPQLAEDTAALMRHLGIARADVLGYSLGAGVALELAIQHPDLVRKVVLISVSYNAEGLHPGLAEGMDGLQPEHLMGSPFHEEYMRLAPRPEDFPSLVAKIKEMNLTSQSWPAEQLKAITAPVLVIIGDSDIVRPEHAVEMFRLFGGGVMGDNVGLPNARLAILPGTTHVTVVHRAPWLTSMVTEFLDAPTPGAE